MCKAISDIGMAITKAKLQVYGPTEEPKKTKPKKVKKPEKEDEEVEEVITTEKVKTVKKVGKKQEKESSVVPLEYEVSSQPLEEEVVEPFEESFKTQKGILKMVESERVVAEIDELMQVINAKEFGPGQSPLRELAKIGYVECAYSITIYFFVLAMNQLYIAVCI